jgi:hypothetical protein
VSRSKTTLLVDGGDKQRLVPALREPVFVAVIAPVVAARRRDIRMRHV